MAYFYPYPSQIVATAKHAWVFRVAGSNLTHHVPQEKKKEKRTKVFFFKNIYRLPYGHAEPEKKKALKKKKWDRVLTRRPVYFRPRPRREKCCRVRVTARLGSGTRRGDRVITFLPAAQRTDLRTTVAPFVEGPKYLEFEWCLSPERDCCVIFLPLKGSTLHLTGNNALGSHH